MSTLAIATPSRRRSEPRLATELRALVEAITRDLLNPYRPEKHYMRGPGPKWHAKHGTH